MGWLSRSAALAATAILLLVGLAGAVAAEPRDLAVTIERDEFTSRFPDGMDFRLVVQSSRPIDDVRLIYHLGHSSIGVRTRPDFTPGTTIDVDWTMRTGRASYLPPMLEVRYQFELTTADGEVVTTPTRTVLYEDPRFDWREVEARGIQLYYYGVTALQAQQVADEARAKVAVMEELFETELAEPVRGVVYQGRDIQSALSFRSDTTTAEGHFGGEAYSSVRLFTISGMAPNGIAHETTHILLRDMLRRGMIHVPSWLNEGLAVYSERGQPDGPERFTRAMSLHRMLGVPSRREDIGLHYQQGYSTVAFLLREYGDEAMRVFLRSIGRGEPIDDASTEAFGVDLLEIENQWRDSVGLAPRRESAEPAPGISAAGWTVDEDEQAGVAGVALWLLPFGGLAIVSLLSIAAGFAVLRKRDEL